ncbi:unnamed protein product [Rhizoctonia solani]|uniref:Uncharacterized protein n=1 Tax=Rhizoctonia solani TaxID=456999 RepID=A0A8H3CUB6_9AGAM|nr:unnamed protein product [Rhizoctonia solani]
MQAGNLLVRASPYSKSITFRAKPARARAIVDSVAWLHNLERLPDNSKSQQPIPEPNDPIPKPDDPSLEEKRTMIKLIGVFGIAVKRHLCKRGHKQDYTSRLAEPVPSSDLRHEPEETSSASGSTTVCGTQVSVPGSPPFEQSERNAPLEISCSLEGNANTQTIMVPPDIFDTECFSWFRALELPKYEGTDINSNSPTDSDRNDLKLDDFCGDLQRDLTALMNPRPGVSIPSPAEWTPSDRQNLIFRYLKLNEEDHMDLETQNRRMGFVARTQGVGREAKQL